MKFANENRERMVKKLSEKDFMKQLRDDDKIEAKIQEILENFDDNLEVSDSSKVCNNLKGEEKNKLGNPGIDENGESIRVKASARLNKESREAFQKLIRQIALEKITKDGMPGVDKTQEYANRELKKLYEKSKSKENLKKLERQTLLEQMKNPDFRKAMLEARIAKNSENTEKAKNPENAENDKSAEDDKTDGAKNTKKSEKKIFLYKPGTSQNPFPNQDILEEDFPTELSEAEKALFESYSKDLKESLRVEKSKQTDSKNPQENSEISKSDSILGKNSGKNPGTKDFDLDEDISILKTLSSFGSPGGISLDNFLESLGDFPHDFSGFDDDAEEYKKITEQHNNLQKSEANYQMKKCEYLKTDESFRKCLERKFGEDVADEDGNLKEFLGGNSKDFLDTTDSDEIIDLEDLSNTNSEDSSDEYEDITNTPQKLYKNTDIAEKRISTTLEEISKDIVDMCNVRPKSSIKSEIKPESQETAKSPTKSPESTEKTTEIDSNIHDFLTESINKKFEENMHTKAETFNTQGNTAFKSGNFKLAEECYTKSIGFQHDQPKYRTNRAISRFKQNMYKKCISDCESALDISNKWVKGYYWKAHAFLKMENFEKAYEVTEEFRKVDPVEAGRLYETVDEKNEDFVLKKMAILKKVDPVNKEFKQMEDYLLDGDDLGLMKGYLDKKLSKTTESMDESVETVVETAESNKATENLKKHTENSAKTAEPATPFETPSSIKPSKHPMSMKDIVRSMLSAPWDRTSPWAYIGGLEILSEMITVNPSSYQYPLNRNILSIQ